LTDDFGGTAVVQTHNGGPEDQSFSDAQSGLLVECRMEECACSRKLREQLVTREPSLESNAIRQPPPSYRTFEA